jgi:hyperosmotically inducible protein
LAVNPPNEELFVSDHNLEADVIQALADNPLVDADEIAVHAIDGDVVLRGTVVQLAEAARAARRVPGVRTVDDRLRVRLLSSDARIDADTEAAVLAALFGDDELHAGDVDVEAREGTVIPRGFVERPSQRDRAERIALGVGGVAHVRNQLAVRITVLADDVAARVTDAIGLDAMVGADRITVTVRDNDVTLTGTVTSRDHRYAGVAAVAGAPGVALIADRLNVRTDGS